MAHLRPSLTPYNYVQNNPLNRFDPDGKLDLFSIAKSLNNFISSNPTAAIEIGQIFEVGFSAGGQLGGQAEIGPLKGELSAKVSGDINLNLAGEGNTSVNAEGKAIVEFAGVAEAGIEVGATLDDGSFDITTDPKLGPKDFDLENDLKIGGTVRAVGFGVTAKINVGEAIDALKKGVKAISQKVKESNNAVNNVKETLTGVSEDKKEDY